jgi:glycosyltransferase involved in cell wall biosynthesis
MRELSVVITVMNEEDNIKPLLDAVRQALIGIDFEVILVDDGSTDKTKQQVLEHSDERTTLVELRKTMVKVLP